MLTFTFKDSLMRMTCTHSIREYIESSKIHLIRDESGMTDNANFEGKFVDNVNYDEKIVHKNHAGKNVTVADAESVIVDTAESKATILNDRGFTEITSKK